MKVTQVKIQELKVQEVKVQKLIQCEQCLELEKVGKFLELSRPVFLSLISIYVF